jgi:integrase
MRRQPKTDGFFQNFCKFIHILPKSGLNSHIWLCFRRNKLPAPMLQPVTNGQLLHCMTQHRVNIGVHFICQIRRTFCSLLAQNGVSTSVTQRLLEHSSPNLTNKVYINVDPVLRYAVEQLPVWDWL